MRFLSLSFFHRLGLSTAAVLVLAAGLGACKRQMTLSPAAAAAIRTQVTALRDSADQKWNTMIATDDEKIANVRLLLNELQQAPSADAATLQTLNRSTAHLPAIRYTQEAASSDQISRYDDAQDSLMQALYPVAAPGGNATTDKARDLVENIQQLDNVGAIVSARVRYDRAAQAYNAYVRSHTAELEALGGKFAEAKPLPLFTIGAQ